MNILIAIDSFKGALSSKELADVIEEGIFNILPDTSVSKIPIADGGEGTTETMVEGLGGKKVRLNVHDPLMRNISAEYGLLDDGTSIVEMAQSSGLTLVEKEKQNPLNTTTYGVGDIIKDAIVKGSRNFIIGIGGSATNDGGIGMLASLGYKFYDKDNNLLLPIGSSLNKISRIDDGKRLEYLDECNFLVACDVDNPFYGTYGAAHVYAKQKGASQEEILELDKGLENFSKVIKLYNGIDISDLPGAGAAGGLGGGLKAFLNAELQPGIDIIFKNIKLEEKIKNADIIITGEGKIDFQTVMGKAPIGVAQLGKKHDKIVIALAGALTKDAYTSHDKGVTSMFCVVDMPMTLEDAMEKEHALEMVKNSVQEIFKLIKAVRY